AGRAVAARPWLPGAGAGPRSARRSAPVHGRLRPGRHPVRIADGPVAVRRGHRARHPGAGADAEPGAALPNQRPGDAGRGRVLPALPAQEPLATLHARLLPAPAPADAPGWPGGSRDAGRIAAAAPATGPR